MVHTLEAFQKQKEYLVCVDSDGCAMDTMDCKHIRCFGPCLVREWDLFKWEDAILDRWNEINLYSMTRGINRFLALDQMLTEINEKDTPIQGLSDLTAWVHSGAAPSNDALQKAIDETDSPILKKALHWSEAVNEAIRALPEEVKRPFPGAKEGLAAAHVFADVVIVSSANRDAVTAEWEKFGLSDHVDLMMAQDMGSKAHCISLMRECGYDPNRVLMVGDAPGDLQAAEKNGVHFFPILVKKEQESWKELAEVGFSKFQGGGYDQYETGKIAEFMHNLGSGEES